MENKLTTLTFGMDEKGKELKALLEKREILLSSGNRTEAIDTQIEGYNHLLFSPKKAVRLTHLEKADATTLTQEQKDEFVALVDEQTAFKTSSPVAHIKEELINMIGNDKTLKLVKTSKVTKQNNGFKRVQEMNYIPGSMRTFLVKPTEYEITDVPVSICRCKITLGETPETKKPIVKIDSVSVIYDEYTGALNSHLWSTIYDIVDKPKHLDIDEIADEDIL